LARAESDKKGRSQADAAGAFTRPASASACPNEVFTVGVDDDAWAIVAVQGLEHSDARKAQPAADRRARKAAEAITTNPPVQAGEYVWSSQLCGVLAGLAMNRYRGTQAEFQFSMVSPHTAHSKLLISRASAMCSLRS
jgi:hypothetical protein